jgi:ABC-type hemin transport system ATPase subunit
LLLHEGQVFADGPPEEVLSESNIGIAFGISVCRVPCPGQSIPLIVQQY